MTPEQQQQLIAMLDNSLAAANLAENKGNEIKMAVETMQQMGPETGSVPPSVIAALDALKDEAEAIAEGGDAAALLIGQLKQALGQG